MATATGGSSSSSSSSSHTHRQTDTDRQTHTDKRTQTDRDTDRQTKTDTETDRQRQRQTHTLYIMTGMYLTWTARPSSQTMNTGCSLKELSKHTHVKGYWKWKGTRNCERVTALITARQDQVC